METVSKTEGREFQERIRIQKSQFQAEFLEGQYAVLVETEIMYQYPTDPTLAFPIQNFWIIELILQQEFQTSCISRGVAIHLNDTVCECKYHDQIVSCLYFIRTKIFIRKMKMIPPKFFLML